MLNCMIMTHLIMHSYTFMTLNLLWNNPQLNPDLLRQLLEVLHSCNPFINIYKTAAERIQFLNTNRTEKMRVKLNPQMKLLLELGADRRCSNLPTTNEVKLPLLFQMSASKVDSVTLFWLIGAPKTTTISMILSVLIRPLICLLIMYFFSSSEFRLALSSDTSRS